ncbi:MAG: hypothetical protein SNJ63_06720 [Sphingomonadaceae bacterium]
MSFLLRLLVALLALVLPPLALATGRGRLALVAAGLWAVALLIFFLLAWGPGLLLAALAGVLGAVAVLFARRRRIA